MPQSSIYSDKPGLCWKQSPNLDNDFILHEAHTGPMVSCVQELIGSTSMAQRIGFLSRFSERDTGTMYIFLQAKFQLSAWWYLKFVFPFYFPSLKLLESSWYVIVTGPTQNVEDPLAHCCGLQGSHRTYRNSHHDKI